MDNCFLHLYDENKAYSQKLQVAQTTLLHMDNTFSNVHDKFVVFWQGLILLREVFGQVIIITVTIIYLFIYFCGIEALSYDNYN